MSRRVQHLASVMALALACMLTTAGCGGGDGPADAEVDAPSDGGVEAGREIPPDRGPWVIRVTPTTAVVRWESAIEPASVSLRLTSEADGSTLSFAGTSRADDITLRHELRALDLPDLPGVYHLAEVPIEGLSPATCYTYDRDDDPTMTGRFCTAREPTDHAAPLIVGALGDTSPIFGHTQRVVEQLVARDPELIIHAGDLQYYTTIFESWRYWFQEMQPLLGAGPMYPCIGNHEEELPGEFEATYGRYWDPAGTDGTTSAYHYESAGVHFFSVNSESDIGEYDPAFTWLEARLSEVELEPGFRFSIVYFHRPIYTLGGHAPSLGLRAILQPIVEAHRVPLVLQGHNHAYERFEVNGVTYLVIGNGGAGGYDVDANVMNFPDEVPLRLASGTFHGGALFTIETTRLVAEIFDEDGGPQDSFELTF
ncbi:MAG: metallophosphoesterase [Myxococcales bacterium]|nr:metallophosphoesterase [Myxococcales bacterium]